jgi:DNA-binding transcriptional LysR family regulator
MINPDYLKTFLDLIESKSFTRTAERLYMTQPGVTQHIQKLEEHFECPLLIRQGKTFKLSEKGHHLALYARRLFLDYQGLQDILKGDDPSSGECRVASPGSFGLKLFDILLKSKMKNPGLTILFTAAPNSSIAPLLIERKIDLGFVTKEVDHPEISCSAFTEEKLLLILPKKFKYQNLAELKELGFISHPDGPHLLQRILNAQKDTAEMSAIDFKVQVSVNQLNRILDPVSQGLGFTVLPEGAYQNYPNIKELKIAPLKVNVFDKVFLLTRRFESLPARYDHIIKLLKKE